MMDLDFIVPTGICVVLPITIVWLVMRARQNETNKKAEIMLKAIESGAPVCPDFFHNAQEHGTLKERLLKKLSSGCVMSFIGAFLLASGIFCGIKFGWALQGSPASILVLGGGILFAIGIAYLIVYFTGKKMLAREIEAEEREQE